MSTSKHRQQSQQSQHNRPRKKSRSQTEVDNIYAQLRRPERDFDKIELALEFLLQHGRDDRIEEIFANESLSEEALDDFDFLLLESAYRMQTTIKGRLNYHIPFALLVTIITADGIPKER